MTLLTVISSRYYGGEGPFCSFSEFFVYIDIKSDLFLMRGYTFDDLCVYNNLY